MDDRRRRRDDWDCHAAEHLERRPHLRALVVLGNEPYREELTLRVVGGAFAVEHVRHFKAKPAYATALGNHTAPRSWPLASRTDGEPAFNAVWSRQTRYDRLPRSESGAEEVLALRLEQRVEDDLFTVPPTVSQTRSLAIPLLLVAILGLLPALAVWTRWAMFRRFSKRADVGVCVGCGYDLTATPARCPECGRDFDAPLPRPKRIRALAASAAIAAFALFAGLFVTSFVTADELPMPTIEIIWAGGGQYIAELRDGSLRVAALTSSAWPYAAQPPRRELLPGLPPAANFSWTNWRPPPMDGTGRPVHQMREVSVPALPIVAVVGLLAWRLGRWRLGATKTSRRGGRPGGEGTGPGSFRAASSRT